MGMHAGGNLAWVINLSDGGEWEDDLNDGIKTWLGDEEWDMDDVASAYKNVRGVTVDTYGGTETSQLALIPWGGEWGDTDKYLLSVGPAYAVYESDGPHDVPSEVIRPRTLEEVQLARDFLDFIHFDGDRTVQLAMWTSYG